MLQWPSSPGREAAGSRTRPSTAAGASSRAFSNSSATRSVLRAVEPDGLHLHVEQRHRERAALVDLQPPAGAGHVAGGDHAEAARPRAGEGREPVGQRRVGPRAEDGVLRDHAGTAGEPAGEDLLRAALRDAAVEPLEQRGVVVDQHQPVAGEVREHLGEVVSVDPLLVGPGGGGELDGQRRDDLGRGGLVPGDGDDSPDRLEVDQDVGALHRAAQADEPGERCVAELDRLLGVAAQAPGAALVDRGPRRRGVRPGRREAQVDGVVVDLHREHRRQLALLGTAGGAEPAQRAVETGGPLLVGADQQADLGLEGLVVGGGAAAATALGEQGGEQAGGDDAATGQVAREVRGLGGRLGGVDRTARVGLLVAAGGAVDLGDACVGGDRRRRRVHAVEALGVLGHDQHPAGLDQTAEHELAAVGLEPALVEVEDLLPAAAVVEVPLGDVPEVVVVAAVRRLHEVDLLADHVGHVARHAGVLGAAVVPVAAGDGVVLLVGAGLHQGGLLLAAGLHGGGGGQVARRRAGQGGGHRGAGAAGEHAADQQGADERAGELLGAARERHRPRHATTADEAHRLDDGADRELRPGQPHDGAEHGQHGVEGDRLGQGLAGRQPAGVRRRAGEQPQAHRDPDDQHEQRDRGTERLEGGASGVLGLGVAGEPLGSACGTGLGRGHEPASLEGAWVRRNVAGPVTGSPPGRSPTRRS